MSFDAQDVSICIPTYERGSVLVETLEALVGQAGELLVVDQTPQYPPDIAARLEAWNRSGAVRWIRLTRPAIPRAMNTGLQCARRPLTLFLDDDIEPQAGLVAAHAQGYAADQVWGVAGQVLQPGEAPGPPRSYTRCGFRAYLDFPFHSNEPAVIANGMAGNLSVRRDRALQVGGFNESFQGVAYRFETEFCRRLCRFGGEIRFDPAASIRHLRAQRGGTRSLGNHLTSASPDFGVGDYYFAMHDGTVGAWAYALRRPWREIATRFHLRQPWWIPVKLLGELRAMRRAYALARLSGSRGRHTLSEPLGSAARAQQPPGTCPRV